MKKFFRALPKYVDDLLVLGGCCTIVYGLSLWNIVAMWIMAGVLLIALGLLYGKYSS